MASFAQVYCCGMVKRGQLCKTLKSVNLFSVCVDQCSSLVTHSLLPSDWCLREDGSQLSLIHESARLAFTSICRVRMAPMRFDMAGKRNLVLGVLPWVWPLCSGSQAQWNFPSSCVSSAWLVWNEVRTETIGAAYRQDKRIPPTPLCHSRSLPTGYWCVLLSICLTLFGSFSLFPNPQHGLCGHHRAELPLTDDKVQRHLASHLFGNASLSAACQSA